MGKAAPMLEVALRLTGGGSCASTSRKAAVSGATPASSRMERWTAHWSVTAQAAAAPRRVRAKKRPQSGATTAQSWAIGRATAQTLKASPRAMPAGRTATPLGNAPSRVALLRASTAASLATCRANARRRRLQALALIVVRRATWQKIAWRHPRAQHNRTHRRKHAHHI